MATISQTIFLYPFSRKKSFVFSLKFHWNLFLRVQLAITQHYWVPSHYLNQCWSNSLTHICGTRGRWVNGKITVYRLLFHVTIGNCRLDFETLNDKTMYVCSPIHICTGGISYVSGNLFHMFWQNRTIHKARHKLMHCNEWTEPNLIMIG